MKTLTLLIFSGDRFNIKGLLDDITKLNQSRLNVAVVEWCENKKILDKKFKLYSSYKKKIKNLKVYYQKGNWEFKYPIFINKFKSKYILLIGDDDRINIKNFEKIYKYLDLNLSGLTLSFTNFKNNKDLSIKKEYTTDEVRLFNIFKDVHRIGYTSCQIINVKFISQVLKTEKKYLLKTKFPQNFLILKIIKKFKNWKILNINCIYNRVGSLDYVYKDDQLLTRLKSEYLGYLIPIKKNFKNFNLKQLDKIYTNIFFKNILSWWYLAIKYHGKKKIFQNLKDERNILREPLIIKLTLIFIFLSPLFLLNIMRILRRIFSLKV